MRYRLAHYRECKAHREWNTTCPACGRKGKFVPYIDTHTMRPVDDRQCGRCNRESNCGYHMPPSEWFKEHRPPLSYGARKRDSLVPKNRQSSQPTLLHVGSLYGEKAPQGQQHHWLPREQYVELMRQRRKEAREACLLDPLRDTRSYPLPLRVLPLSQRESADSSIAEEVTKKNCLALSPLQGGRGQRPGGGLRGTSEVEQGETELRGSENITTYLSHMSTLCLKTRSDKNHLARWLCTQVAPGQVAEVLARYRTGSTRDGRIIYWQIDECGQVRAGKVMAYDLATGHRKKEGGGNVCWVHSMRIDGIKYDELPVPQCLFGEHLINVDVNANDNRHPDGMHRGAQSSFSSSSSLALQAATPPLVMLVESEKTALIMSLVCPDRVWLATGGKANLKAAMLEPLIGLDVALYPDADALHDWYIRAVEMNRRIGTRFHIPTWYYNLMDHDEARHAGWDLADVVFRV